MHDPDIGVETLPGALAAEPGSVSALFVEPMISGLEAAAMPSRWRPPTEDAIERADSVSRLLDR